MKGGEHEGSPTFARGRQYTKATIVMAKGEGRPGNRRQMKEFKKQTVKMRVRHASK